MSSPSGLIDLAERKELLIQQADVHRRLLGMERQYFLQRLHSTQAQFPLHRWWLIGGATVAGWLMARRLGGISRWLPTVLAAARIAQSFRK